MMASSSTCKVNESVTTSGTSASSAAAASATATGHFGTPEAAPSFSVSSSCHHRPNRPRGRYQRTRMKRMKTLTVFSAGATK